MPLTDEQIKALGLDMPAPSVAIAPSAPPAGILPPAAPVEYPQSILGDKLAPGAKLTSDALSTLPHDQGKQAFQDLMPKITADPGTTDYFRQRQQQLDYKTQHPWGSPISDHPGTAGKILHGLSVAGNILGDVVDPSAMSIIPGTQLHNHALEAENEKGMTQGVENDEKEAQTENLNAQPELKRQAAELNQEKQNAKEDKDKSDITEKYRKLGLKLDPQGNAVPIPYEEMAPTEQAVHDLKTNQAEAAEARAELDKMKGDTNSPLYQMQMKRLQVAMQNAQNAQSRLGLSEKQFANKVNEQELLKPSGQAQSRGSAAQSALNVLPELQDQIRANAEELGPIMGRIQRGEIKLGDVDPKVAKLYSTMQSFYAMQPAIHGFRNAEFVKDFNSFVGGLERDPEATLAGLEGLVPTMQSIATEGKTFHKRIVEGGGNAGGGASGKAPAVGTIEDGHRFKGGDPGKAENWEAVKK